MAAPVCALPWPGAGSQGCRCGHRSAAAGCRTGAALKHQPGAAAIRLSLSWASPFCRGCFVLHLCCRKLLHWQREKPVRQRSASWTGRKVQGKFHGTDQACTTRSQTQSLFRKGVSGIFWILAEMQGAHDTQSCEFLLLFFFFLFKQNWSFSEMFQSFVLRPLSGMGYMREEGC